MYNIISKAYKIISVLLWPLMLRNSVTMATEPKGIRSNKDFELEKKSRFLNHTQLTMHIYPFIRTNHLNQHSPKQFQTGQQAMINVLISYIIKN